MFVIFKTGSSNSYAEYSITRTSQQLSVTHCSFVDAVPYIYYGLYTACAQQHTVGNYQSLTLQMVTVH